MRMERPDLALYDFSLDVQAHELMSWLDSCGVRAAHVAILRSCNGVMRERAIVFVRLPKGTPEFRAAAIEQINISEKLFDGTRIKARLGKQHQEAQRPTGFAKRLAWARKQEELTA
jgi:hypothetical protein